MKKHGAEADRISFARSFRDDYALLEDGERRRVDAIVERLRRGERGRLVALDERRRARGLDVPRDEILCVTDGFVTVDILCRAGGEALVLLGADGRCGDYILSMTG